MDRLRNTDFLSANGDHLVQEIGLATQMYASQWFLTLFAAKFPLFLVFLLILVLLLLVHVLLL